MEVRVAPLVAEASATVATTDFVDVSEVAGEPVPREQVLRMASRYRWAADQAAGGLMLEVGCGAGQGSAILASAARHLVLGDISAALLDQTRKVAPRSADVVRCDAMHLPFPSSRFNTVLVAEALYFVPDVETCIRECQRILSPDGQILVVTANKDLYDFSPSKYSTRYLGVSELSALFARQGMQCTFAADFEAHRMSLRQRLFRPIKWLAVRFRLVPRTMKGKRLIKRMMFGKMAPMPALLEPDAIEPSTPIPIDGNSADTRHKVLYCIARRDKK